MIGCIVRDATPAWNVDLEKLHSAPRAAAGTSTVHGLTSLIRI